MARVDGVLGGGEDSWARRVPRAPPRGRSSGGETGVDSRGAPPGSSGSRAARQRGVQLQRLGLGEEGAQVVHEHQPVGQLRGAGHEPHAGQLAGGRPTPRGRGVQALGAVHAQRHRRGPARATMKWSMGDRGRAG